MILHTSSHNGEAFWYLAGKISNCLSLNIQLPFKSSKMVDRLFKIDWCVSRSYSRWWYGSFVYDDQDGTWLGIRIDVVLILSNKKQQLAERIISNPSLRGSWLIDLFIFITTVGSGFEKRRNWWGNQVKRKIKDYKYWILSFFQHVSFNFNISSIIKITISINTLWAFRWT